MKLFYHVTRLLNVVCHSIVKTAPKELQIWLCAMWKMKFGHTLGRLDKPDDSPCMINTYISYIVITYIKWYSRGPRVDSHFSKLMSSSIGIIPLFSSCCRINHGQLYMAKIISWK